MKKEKMKIAKKGKGEGRGKERLKKAVIGILLAVIMLGSAFSMITHLTTGSDVTRTTVRNSYVVNPDNVTISIDGNTSSVLIGQNVQFMYGGNKTGTVTVTGVEGTLAEGHVVTSDSTGWLDTSVMVEGLYNATYENQWELLAVDSPEMALWFKVGETGVSSITQGTPLGIGFTSNLDVNDCVDLKVVTPEGYVLSQNPADPDQKFDDINVSKLLEYGSENKLKRVNTSGWDIGTYTFWVRSEEENARGLDVPTCAITLAVCKADITIEAEKTSIVELEKVRLTVAGVPDHNITISGSDPAHTIFPAGYEDNPPYDTSGFNDTIDEDGQRRYVVYFNDTGTYTITVTDATADLDDDVDISVSEKRVTFDVPAKVVIGEEFTIKGAANTGDLVDVAVEDYVYPQLNDLIIDEKGEFSKEIDTATANITPFTVPGSVLLDAYIDRAAGVGPVADNETDDGSIAILMVSVDLIAELSTDNVAQGDDFTVSGTAKGSTSVDIVVVAPKGSNGSMIEPGGTPLQAGTNIYHVTSSVSEIDCTFAKKIRVGLDVDTGSYLVVVLTKGRDNRYGLEYDNFTSALAAYNLTSKTQAQILAILEDATIETVGSDDLLWAGCINVILIPHPYLNVNISKDAVTPGSSFEVYGNASTDYVEIVAISPKGGNDTGMDGLYGVSIYTVPTFRGEGIITGHIEMVRIIHDYCSGQPNMIFLPRELKPEDYTIYAKTDDITFLTDPDENGNFSLKVLYGRYNISVEPSLLCEPGTCYSYPEIDLFVNQSPFHLNITPEESFYSPTPATMPNARGRIYGHIDFSDDNKENLSVNDLVLKAYLLHKPGFVYFTNPDENGNYSFENLVLGTGSYSVEVIPSGILTRSGKVCFNPNPFEISFEDLYYPTLESIILEKKMDIGYTTDCNTIIIIVAPFLRVNLSTSTMIQGFPFVINGTATGTDHVDLITISPGGGDGTGLYEKSYPAVPGITNESIPVENNSFSKTINVSDGATLTSTLRRVGGGGGGGGGAPRDSDYIYVIWVSVPGRDGYYGNWQSEGVNTSDKLIERIIDDYCGGDANNLRLKTQEQILAILQDVTVNMAGSDDLACIMELTVGHLSYNYDFYKRIKVDSGADTGNYTILVLSPERDGIYGDSYYSYINSILDLDGEGPELGAIDVSNRTKEEIVAIIEDIIYAAGSDDFMWTGNIVVTQFDVFDTGESPNPYPSIFGTHNGTITPFYNINVSKMYTYSCPGTGGHTEYVAFYNTTTEEEIVNGSWNGYQGAGDYHCIEFDSPLPFILQANVTYNYTIKTGSYPQIHHTDALPTAYGWINCTKFVDGNGRVYYTGIPAIKLFHQ